MAILPSLFGGKLPGAIFFDLDGTLLDSAPDLAQAVDLSLREFGHPEAGIDKVRSWIGNGARKLMERALADALCRDAEAQLDSEIVDQGLGQFLDHYDRCCSSRSCLYDGVAQTLASLYQQGVKLACITNKPAQFTTKLLDYFSIDRYFSVVVSGDTLSEKKPHPLPVIYAAQQLELPLQACLMVGDSRSDVLAARAAEIKVLCVTYGYNQGLDSHELAADAYIDEMTELL